MTHSDPDSPDGRAAVAEASVGELFGGRVARLPVTHIGHITHPAPRGVAHPWHYWWQAHYLDAIVDAGERHLRHGDPAEAARRAAHGDRLVATIFARNALRFRNAYFDDMAWVVLALGRLRRLHDALHPGRPHRLIDRGSRELTERLRAGLSDELGGGAWWNTTRDFKNVPATSPIALHLARIGDTRTAHALVDWMYDRMLDPTSGLMHDGVRVDAAGERMVTDIYTYNQGPVLGTLVTLGDATSRERATDLVAAVRDRLTTAAAGGHPLITHGDGDGGLFTGILVRYLDLVAADVALDSEPRRTASTLVADTAEALWSGREERESSRHGHITVFSHSATEPAALAYPTGAPIELSTQLQAWMVLEAAARLGSY